MSETTYYFVISRETPFNYVVNTTDPDPLYRRMPHKGTRMEQAVFSMSFPNEDIDWDAVIERGTKLYPHLLSKDMPMVEVAGAKHLRSIDTIPQKLANGSWGKAYVFLYEKEGRV